MPPHDKTKSTATHAYAIARVSSEGQEEYSPAAQKTHIASIRISEPTTGRQKASVFNGVTLRRHSQM